ncbi:MAG: radical SAM family heme chaperone HemW [Oscillospiraceae bacterium]|nr:radical SAM family heme chaperone HemW [Oscillospiraceae bacterium]
MTAPAGIYIHVPFCAVKCPYCDFYSQRYDRQTVQAYTEAVCRNLRALPAGLHADTLYFGGGTPSLLSGAQLMQITQAVREAVQLDADAEVTLEANPLTVTAAALNAWKAAGINRLSLGIQSVQPEVLRILGRRHTPEQAKSAVLRAQDAGFANLSADLMFGLAVQDAECLAADIDALTEMDIPHISAYMLKIEQNTPFAAQPPARCDDDAQADRYLQMHGLLTAAGYEHYEISNFARAGFGSRHNCKYWRLHPYYGIGPAAHSCHDGKRFAVPRDLAGFIADAVQQEDVTEPEAESVTERVMLGLRLKEGIRTDMLPDADRARILRRAKPLMPQYLTLTDGTLAMTPAGWLVSNAVLTALL